MTEREPVGGFLEGGGVHHAKCNYLGVVVPDRGVWFCNKCGHGGLMSGRLIDAILDIDAHATGLKEDADGFVSGGYIITVGSLHRALGVIGHTAPKCRLCDPSQHSCATAVGAVLNAAQDMTPANSRRDGSRLTSSGRHNDGATT